MDNIKSESTDRLFKAILSLNDADECYKFFRDICTTNEIHALGQRLDVAFMLIQKHTYIDIAEKTSASTATISRVNRALRNGEGGYNIIYSRINE